MDKLKLNNLVLLYQDTREEATFNEIYTFLSSKWKSLDTIGKSVLSNKSEVTGAYEDTLLRCVTKYTGESDFENFFNASLRITRAYLYRNNKKLNSREILYEDESFMYEFASEYNLEETIFKTKKADQRKLIDYLVSEADETTTAIVETFLQHSKPTPTAIGKQLGIHHSTVIRKLERLAGKFDSKQHGSYSDYLVAL